MKKGKILITGGTGFLGVALAEELLRKDESERIILADIVRGNRIDSIADKVQFIPVDLTETDSSRELIDQEVGTVYHLASLVSGGAEKSFEAGLRINIHGTMNLLEACRLNGYCPRFVFTSSIATFGGAAMPETIDDYTHQHPQNSYGVAKVIGEQLLNDYSRKGYIDGRGVRLAAIVVRDEPNSAASGYVSSIVREPVLGNDYTCPVPKETRLPILSIIRCINTLITLGELPEGSLGDYRTINSPSINPSALEIADAVARVEAGSGGVFGKITFQSDPAVAEIVKSWPENFTTKRAVELGLIPDESVDEIAEQYVKTIQATSI